MINLEPLPVVHNPAEIARWLYSVYRVLTQKVSDILRIDLNSHGNSSGSGDTNLASYSYPSGSLYADNQSLTVEAFGTYAANGNSKRLRVNFSATNVFDTGAVTVSGGSWKIVINIYRTASSAQRYISTYLSSNGSPGQLVTYGTATIDLTSGTAITFVGNGVDASDVIQEGMVVKWHPAV